MLSGPVQRTEKSIAHLWTLDIPVALIAPQLYTKSSMRNFFPSTSFKSCGNSSECGCNQRRQPYAPSYRERQAEFPSASQSHITCSCRAESASLTSKLGLLSYHHNMGRALLKPCAVLRRSLLLVWNFQTLRAYSFKGSFRCMVGGEWFWRWKMDRSS